MIAAKIERELLGFVPGVERREMKFDDVWQLYNEVSGNRHLLKELIQRGLIDVAELRKMAVKDLEYSLKEGAKDENKLSTQYQQYTASTAQGNSRVAISSQSGEIDPNIPSAPPSEDVEVDEGKIYQQTNNLPFPVDASPSSSDAHLDIIAKYSLQESNWSSHIFKRWPTLITSPRDQSSSTLSSISFSSSSHHTSRGHYSHSNHASSAGAGQERRTLLFRMRLYSSFLMAFIGIPAALISAALNKDAELEDMSFEEALEDGICELSIGPSALVSPMIIRGKCSEFIHRTGTTFDQFVEKNGRILLDEGLIDPSLLSPLFFRDCLQKLSCVDLLDEWYEWPIQRWGKELGLDEKSLRLLSSLSSQLSSARLTFTNDISGYLETQRKDLKRAKKRRAREEEKIASERAKEESSNQSSPSKHGSSTRGSSHPKSSSTNLTSSSSQYSSSSASQSTHPSIERLDAELDLEEMRIQEVYDHNALTAKRRLEESERHINDAWRALFH